MGCALKANVFTRHSHQSDARVGTDEGCGTRRTRTGAHLAVGQRFQVHMCSHRSVVIFICSICIWMIWRAIRMRAKIAFESVLCVMRWPQEYWVYIALQMSDKMRGWIQWQPMPAQNRCQCVRSRDVRHHTNSLKITQWLSRSVFAISQKIWTNLSRFHSISVSFHSNSDSVLQSLSFRITVRETRLSVQ